jgi:hypothetical protein
MTDWVPLGDTGIEVTPRVLNDPQLAAKIARILDYKRECKADGTLMKAERISAILADENIPADHPADALVRFGFDIEDDAS